MPAEAPLRPTCTIIGGPNGSGKSTIYGRLDLPGRFINADNIARHLNPVAPASAAIAAGRHVLITISKALDARESFVYETTLSSRQSIELMRNAAALGYEVNLAFVGLQNAAMNIERVANRVARGGHHIPDDVIRRRFDTTLRRLPEAIQLADESKLFDNSASTGPRLVLQVMNGVPTLYDFDEADRFHSRLAQATADALGVPVASLREGRPGP